VIGALVTLVAASLEAHARDDDLLKLVNEVEDNVLAAELFGQLVGADGTLGPELEL